MKQDIHPDNYRLVVIKDVSSDYAFLTRSTAKTKETIKWEDGKEYPLIKVEISYKSHPFYTGKMQYVDTAGRIEKFKKRYAKYNQQQDDRKAKAAKAGDKGKGKQEKVSAGKQVKNQAAEDKKTKK